MNNVIFSNVATNMEQRKEEGCLNIDGNHLMTHVYIIECVIYEIY